MSSLKVAVRCRPFNKREIDQESNLIVQMDGKKTRLLKSNFSKGLDNRHHDFTFDHSYWSVDKNDANYINQETVFNDLGKPVVECAFEGYNACVFAYGQTGSGKTFTMMGITQDSELEGLVPRICKSLFSRIELGLVEGIGYKVQVSYLEIYNEKVRDLLSPGTGFGLKVREHKDKGPYVENLSQHSVSDFPEIFKCITKGNEQRTTASTNMNDTSSRSHAIFTITFVQANYLNDLPSETISKIHLVDLAGCERYSKTGITGKTQVKESAHINKSLVTLGSVISSLAEITLHTNKKILYIPYRDSTLTWLLKDSLGGNSKTIMIATISPADSNYGETLSTLRYANRAKNIINKPTINEDPNVRLIKELRDEISSLKNLLSQGNVHLKEPALKVLEDLHKKEAQEKVLTEEWAEKWREAQSILREEKTLGLKKSGFGVTLDSESPHLIGINDNITGVTLYSLKEGETFIGTNTSSDPVCDIVLSGMGILPVHCKIILRNGIATIFPYENAQCWLNANLITQSMAISQGDIILLGRTNMFRYNNPAEHALIKMHPDRGSRMDMVSLIAASRENLCNSFLSDDENSSMFSSTSSPLRPKLHEMRNDHEYHEENKKILETIENALEQLNLERIQMHEHYKHKVNRYTHELERLDREHGDALAIIDCKIQELMAKQEMILWERSNAKTQVIILNRQVATLQSQFSSRRDEFIDFVAKELQELQICGKLDEKTSEQIKSTPIIEDCSRLLWEAAGNLDSYSSHYLRENIRKNRDEIQKYEVELVKKDKLLSEYTAKLAEMDERLLQLEREKLQLKKQSLSLNLKRTTANNDVQTDTSGLTSKTCESETNENQTNSGSGTCDSFHTANSDCFLTPSFFPGKNDLIANVLPTPSLSMSSKQSDLQPELPEPPEQNTKTCEMKLSLKSHAMSDSGVCLESNNHNNSDQNVSNKTELATSSAAVETQTEAILIFEDDSLSTHSSHIFYDNFITAQMKSLQEKIATIKAEIMKCLELGGNKEVLDEKINELQDLQRDYVKLEIRQQEYGLARADGCSDESRLNPLFMSSYSTRNNSLTTPIIAQHFMTRSLPAMESGLGFQPEHFISIGSYMLRGAGMQTHFEYEVRIYLQDAKWSILRRYRRFRELHLSMKHLYGQRVANISFPRKELFGSTSEKVAKSRRCQLEIYLRRLLVVCSRIPQCPIFEGEGGQGGLTKTNLVEFSPFFNACCLDFVCECG